MEIVFVWIDWKIRNLENAGFNLGSEYNYELEIDETNRACKLTRTRNENFIPDFFKPFLNISAIVGENASGKSSFIDALYFDFLFSNNKESKCLILYKHGTKYSYYINFDYTESILPQTPFSISLASDEPNEINSIEKKTPWKVFLNDKLITEMDNSINSCKIKYSSFIDLNSGLHGGNNNNGYIDISANHLLYKDVSEGLKDSFSNEPLSNHKYNTTKQSVKFILEWKDSKLYNFISIPDNIAILNTYTGRKSKLKEEKIEWPNHSGKEEVKKMYDFVKKVLRPHITEFINNNNPTSPHHFDVFIGSLVDSLVEALYLSYRDFDTVEVNFSCSENDLINLSPEEAVFVFLKKQNIFDVKAVVDFIEEVRQSIDSADDKTREEREWTTKVSDKTLELIEKQKAFKNAIRIGERSVKLSNIIDFDWRDMSSGEKAYLNLFSRFNYARELILDSLDDATYRNNALLPDIIYILIDEGEIGFHLQWQKEYISKLHNVLPEILKFEGHEVKLQLIFTTHSPISLSDMPNDRVIYLKDGEVQKGRQKTFGANISDLFADSFFFSNGLIGDFARNRINETIDWLRNLKKIDNYEYHKNVIANIDELTIKRKLAEMYSDKMKDNMAKEIERERIIKMKEDFKSKYKEEL
ncbi:MAG: hypothetical protein RBS07_18220 [Lentimicrobium sp.]|jgi:predicted ATPase|nr:hypothetical protein [Lentimicrobium sp.]